MSKLPKQYQFIDLSDYGRSIAHWIASSLKNTRITPLHITSLFIVSGILAIVCVTYDFRIMAAFFLILKSILDAADGELSRLKNTPSYTGRYYDSIADYILNFAFLLTFWSGSEYSILYLLLAFSCLQLQGTLYNYYYVILRHKAKGDVISRIFEDIPPKAMTGEKQSTVNTLHKIHFTLYNVFDKIIYLIDKEAVNVNSFPKWFMTLISALGLGFQLLIMAILLVLELEIYIIPFFIVYSLLIPLYVGIRRTFL